MPVAVALMLAGSVSVVVEAVRVMPVLLPNIIGVSVNAVLNVMVCAVAVVFS